MEKKTKCYNSFNDAVEMRLKAVPQWGGMFVLRLVVPASSHGAAASSYMPVNRLRTTAVYGV